MLSDNHRVGCHGGQLRDGDERRFSTKFGDIRHVVVVQPFVAKIVVQLRRRSNNVFASFGDSSLLPSTVK
jgi:hypothetical protein